MNKLLVRANLETNIFDFPLIKGNLKCRPALALLLDVKSRYVLAYAVAPSHDIGKAEASALRKGYDSSRGCSDTYLNYSIDCVLVNGLDRRNAKIKKIAMRFGIDIAYTHPRHHDLTEALILNLSGALMPHQLRHSYNNSHPINFEVFELELERAITAHNETPLKFQLRSARELLYDQHRERT